MSYNMRRLTSRTLIYSKLDSIDSPKSQSSNPSVLLAINKYKNTQVKIQETHHRYRVLQRHNSKEKLEEESREKRKLFSLDMRASIEKNKNQKRQIEIKKQKQLEERFAQNLKKKEENKRMIENIRKSFLTANHQTYEEIKKKKEKNQQVIQKFKLQVLQEKASKRQKESEKQDQRRRSVQNFYDSRVKSIRVQKIELANSFIRRQNSRQKYLREISSRNSQVRLIKLQNSRENSKDEEVTNPEKKTAPVTLN